MANKAITYTNIKVQNINSNETYSEVDYSNYDFKILDESKNNLLENKITIENGGKYTILLFSNSINQTSLDYVFLTGEFRNNKIF